MRRLIIFGAIAALFCGCDSNEYPDRVLISNQQDGWGDDRIELPYNLRYDHHSYNITPTGGVITIYYKPISLRKKED